jgi:histidyl-tRNA synthetase
MVLNALRFPLIVQAELLAKANPRIKTQLKLAEDKGTKVAIIIGNSEIQQGVVAIKNMLAREQATVPRSEMVSYIQKLLGNCSTATPTSPVAAAAAATTSTEAAV